MYKSGIIIEMMKLTVFPVPLGPNINVSGLKNSTTPLFLSSGPKLRMPCMLNFSILDIIIAWSSENKINIF